jgi:hypothetical protein
MAAGSASISLLSEIPTQDIATQNCPRIAYVCARSITAHHITSGEILASGAEEGTLTFLLCLVSTAHIVLFTDGGIVGFLLTSPPISLLIPRTHVRDLPCGSSTVVDYRLCTIEYRSGKIFREMQCTNQPTHSAFCLPFLSRICFLKRADAQRKHTSRTNGGNDISRWAVSL